MNIPGAIRDIVRAAGGSSFDAAALRGQSSPAGRSHCLGAPAKAGLIWKVMAASPAAVTFTAGLYLSDRVGLIDLTYLLTGAR